MFGEGGWFGPKLWLLNVNNCRDHNLMTWSGAAVILTSSTQLWIMARNVWINNVCIKSGLSLTQNCKTLCKFQLGSDRFRHEVVPQISGSRVPNVHFTIRLTENYLTIWERGVKWVEEDGGEWPIRLKKSSKCRPVLCDWGQWGPASPVLSLARLWTPWRGSGDPLQSD